MRLPDSMSLGEARQWLRDRVSQPGGERCPCCTQIAAVHKWTLYGTAINALDLIVRIGGTTKWVEAKQLKNAGHKGQGDGTRLKHWGFVEHGKRGQWRAFPYGVSFLRGEVSVHRHLDVYDNRVLKQYGELVTVRDLVGQPFDLPAHLAEIPESPGRMAM